MSERKTDVRVILSWRVGLEEKGKKLEGEGGKNEKEAEREKSSRSGDNIEERE